MPLSYQVKEISTITGSSVATIRSWSSTFAEFLSATANPEEGQPRIFTAKDLAVIQRIVELRNQERLGYDAIKERLRREGTINIEPYIDLPVEASIHPSTSPQTPVATIESHQTPSEGHTALQTAIELYTNALSSQQAIVTRLDALQQRVDAQDKDKNSRITLLALGFVAGLLVAAILVGVAWLMK